MLVVAASAASAVVRLGRLASPRAATPVPPHPCRHTRAATPMPRQMFDKEGKGFVTVEEMKKKMCSATPS